MSKTQALETIEAALNAAIQKGVFSDLKTAFYLHECLQTLKQDINEPGITNSIDQ